MSDLPLWSPHFLDGIGLGDWTRLLVRHRFRIAPRYYPAAFMTSLFAPLNSALGAVQSLAFRSRLEAVRIDPPPVFVLGHWRSGTTLLHELLALNPAHTAPTNHQCLMPKHFLVTGRLSKRLMARLLPAERVMDPMRLGPDSPQEEEFALCNLGVCSPYLWLAFPNEGYDTDWETLEALPHAETARWKAAYLGFLKSVALAAPGRLVLKCPLNGFRLALLERMFPNARYVHIMRHPAEVLSSTVRTWRALQAYHGYQTPREGGLMPHVLKTGLHLHRALAAGRARIAATRWCNVHFEDLVRDPHDVLQRIHKKLGLSDYAPSAAGVTAYLAERVGFQPRTRVSDDELATARTHWAELFEADRYV
jgi:hypothetical protein